MKCRSFIPALEEYFDTHPDATSTQQLSRELASHVGVCAECKASYRQALQSRVLLASLRASRRPDSEDPYFLTRVKARIAAQQARRFWPFVVAWRDVITAVAIFLITLGTFVYDIHRVETPHADEAIAVDAPHVNTAHPADDHEIASAQDVMVTLLTP
jgi:hypothetical protein